jgi:8-oxo-dGTP pyrophosphatase MutT (NUDIX family)
MAASSPDGGIDPARIRDAACVVIVDDDGGTPRLLLGRRHADQIFLPSKWVFPGGRVDPGDHELAASWQQRAPQPAAAQVPLAFALAAIREVFEETGLLIGREPNLLGSAPPSQEWPVSWQGLVATGHEPAWDRLTPIARAITPPGRPRRYDTWFFLAHRAAVSAVHGTGDGELLDPGWFTLTEVRALDLPNITRLIVDDVATRLDRGFGHENAPIPFYFQDNAGFQRVLIDVQGVTARP